MAAGVFSASEATIGDLARVPDGAKAEPALPSWVFPVENLEDLVA